MYVCVCVYDSLRERNHTFHLQTVIVHSDPTFTRRFSMERISPVKRDLTVLPILRSVYESLFKYFPWEYHQVETIWQAIDSTAFDDSLPLHSIPFEGAFQRENIFTPPVQVYHAAYRSSTSTLGKTPFRAPIYQVVSTIFGHSTSR